MPFKIIRNDITKMKTDAIVNTANAHPIVGPGCDRAVYEAAGFDELLAYRKEHIGSVQEGDAFITPGFHLPAKYIIHAVSPLFVNGDQGEEALLRSCYRKSLALAEENGIRSIAFPLISTGSFGYPKEEGMRIAVDEIHAFLLKSQMLVYLVVFDETATKMGRNLYPDLEAYIDRNYVEEKRREEYADAAYSEPRRPRRPNYPVSAPSVAGAADRRDEQLYGQKEPREQYGQKEPREHRKEAKKPPKHGFLQSLFKRDKEPLSQESYEEQELTAQGFYEESESTLQAPSHAVFEDASLQAPSHATFEEASLQAPSHDMSEDASLQAPEPLLLDDDFAIEEMERKLAERMEHMADTFPQYLMYLIDQKGMENAEVYKRAIVDKKVFSKIKNNPNYHPQKLTALCLCIGAKLNIDESRDLLARAGYALSPCDKTDIIFSYFIEHQIYYMIELDIQLEEHGLPCIIA